MAMLYMNYHFLNSHSLFSVQSENEQEASVSGVSSSMTLDISDPNMQGKQLSAILMHVPV